MREKNFVTSAILDELAIQRVMGIYSEAASRGDLETAVSTFTEDGTWGVPAFNLVCAGREAVLAGLRSFSDPMDYIVQAHCPAIVTVDGENATARSVIRECGKYKGRDEGLEVLGIYVDTLVRTADGWKFTDRSFDLQGIHTFALQRPPAA